MSEKEFLHKGPSLRARGAGVVLRAAVGEQDNQGEDSQRSAERRMEDEHDAQDYRRDAGPGLMVQKAISHENATQTEDRNATPEHVGKRGKSEKWAAIVPGGVKTVPDTHGHDRRNQGQSTDNQPKHREGVKAAFEAGVVGDGRCGGDANGRLSAGAAEIRTGIELGPAVIAEHIGLAEEALNGSTERQAKLFPEDDCP